MTVIIDNSSAARRSPDVRDFFRMFYHPVCMFAAWVNTLSILLLLAPDFRRGRVAVSGRHNTTLLFTLES